MPAPRELERLGGLFDSISERSKPFLDECSKTKFLAVSDYSSATSEYMKLVTKALSEDGLGLSKKSDCQSSLSNVQSALESKRLDKGLLQALEDLRATYLESMVKPAFKTYLHEDSLTKTDIEKVYMNALKIDGLIEVIQFLNRVRRLR
ncbi:MAG: hypothetical protein JW779_13680 [Candidatus Thorarchaeota archaeon]|nr:hypothetical protein [Candidatus Thorarchaeota archaeon]